MMIMSTSRNPDVRRSVGIGSPWSFQISESVFGVVEIFRVFEAGGIVKNRNSFIFIPPYHPISASHNEEIQRLTRVYIIWL